LPIAIPPALSRLTRARQPHRRAALPGGSPRLLAAPRAAPPLEEGRRRRAMAVPARGFRSEVLRI
jgi:hypothetical protein